MHYSGILVRSLPEQFQRCAAQVGTLAGVDVYLTYPSSSCLVAVLESETLDGQEAALCAVQDLPSVASADLVYHHFDEAKDLVEGAAS